MTVEIQNRLKILAAELRRAAKHPHDAEAIHKLRVAIRRFTQALRVFQASFEPAHFDKMRQPLRKVMHRCGEVRNCDIALDVLEAAGVPADNDVEHRLHRLRSRAARALVKRLAAGPTHKDLHRWRTWVQETRAVRPLRLIEQLERDFVRAGNAVVRAEASFTQMHKFRLMVKRYRYTLEILAGPPRQIEMLRGLQERLGAINDCVTTGELVAASGMKRADQRRIKTALNRLLAHRAAEFRLYWRKKKP
jgi:CHAD domain-containing protein